MFYAIIGALIIIGIALICFNLRIVKNEDQASYPIATPKLDLSNPRSILQPGGCSQDADCNNSNLTCLGNTCVLRPDAELSQQCNTDNGCYSVIVGLSQTGIVENQCIPLFNQFYNADNCNTVNTNTCKGTVQGNECIPSGNQSVLYFSTYGGREIIPATLPSKEVAKLFLNANQNILSTSTNNTNNAINRERIRGLSQPTMRW